MCRIGARVGGVLYSIVFVCLIFVFYTALCNFIQFFFSSSIVTVYVNFLLGVCMCLFTHAFIQKKKTDNCIPVIGSILYPICQ